MADFQQAIITGFFAGIGSVFAHYIFEKYLKPRIQIAEKKISDTHQELKNTKTKIKDIFKNT